MSIIITCIDEKPPPPYAVRVELFCENQLCSNTGKFEDPSGYIGCHGLAMSAGWLERQTPAGRAWMCPDCSGKRADG